MRWWDADGVDGRPLLVVDGANVVGSVPDGWWRDRAGAARRLREALGPVADAGIPDGPPDFSEPLDVVLVVEGAARRIADETPDGGTPGGGETSGGGTPGGGGTGPTAVRVIAAPGSGDDTIVDLVRGAAGRRIAVVTADRELRDRVTALGARVLGPRTINRGARA